MSKSNPTDWGLACADCMRAVHRTTNDNFARDYAGLEVGQYAYFTGAFADLRAPSQLVPLVEARVEIVALYRRLGGDAEDEYADGQPDFLLLVRDVPREELALLPAFLAEHEGHHLSPMSEDGVLAAGCPRKPECPTCGVWQRCLSARDHEGSCVVSACSETVRARASVRALAEPVTPSVPPDPQTLGAIEWHRADAVTFDAGANSQTKPAPAPSFAWLDSGDCMGESRRPR